MSGEEINASRGETDLDGSMSRCEADLENSMPVWKRDILERRKARSRSSLDSFSGVFAARITDEVHGEDGRAEKSSPTFNGNFAFISDGRTFAGKRAFAPDFSSPRKTNSKPWSAFDSCDISTADKTARYHGEPESLVLSDSLGPLRDNPFIRMERQRKKHQGREDAARSIQHILEVYGSVPGIRTICAENIIIIESDPDYFRELPDIKTGAKLQHNGRYSSIKGLLDQSCSGVTEIYAQEVVIYNSSLSKSEENLSTSGRHGPDGDPGDLPGQGRVSCMLQKFDCNYEKLRARTRSSESLLDADAGSEGPRIHPKPQGGPVPKCATSPRSATPASSPEATPPHVVFQSAKPSQRASQTLSSVEKEGSGVPLPAPLLPEGRGQYRVPLNLRPQTKPLNVAVRGPPGESSEPAVPSRAEGRGDVPDGAPFRLPRRRPTFEIRPAPRPDPSALPAGDVQARALVNLRLQSRNSFTVIPKRAAPAGPLEPAPTPPPSPLEPAPTPSSSSIKPTPSSSPLEPAPTPPPSPLKPAPTASSSSIKPAPTPTPSSDGAAPSSAIKPAPTASSSPLKPAPSPCPPPSAPEPQTPAVPNPAPPAVLNPAPPAALPPSPSPPEIPEETVLGDAVTEPLDPVNLCTSPSPDPPPYATPDPRVTLPEGSPCAERLPEGSPCAERLPEASPCGERLPEASPCAERLPEASPCAERLPEASPCAERLPEASPCGDRLPEGSPCAERLPVTNIDDVVVEPVPGAASFPVLIRKGNTFTVVPKRRPDSQAAADQPSATQVPQRAPYAELGSLLKKRYPKAEEIEVIGGYLSLSRSCLSKTPSRKKLKISFNESSLQSTFEYPSERSLEEGGETERERGGEEEEEEEEEGGPAIKRFLIPRATYISPFSNTSSSIDLSSYTPKHSGDFSTWQEDELDVHVFSGDCNAEQSLEEVMLVPGDRPPLSDFHSDPALYF